MCNNDSRSESFHPKFLSCALLSDAQPRATPRSGHRADVHHAVARGCHRLPDIIKTKSGGESGCFGASRKFSTRGLWSADGALQATRKPQLFSEVTCACRELEIHHFLPFDCSPPSQYSSYAVKVGSSHRVKFLRG